MKPLIGTSLKMNLTSTDARGYFNRLLPLVERVTGCEIFVLPPFTSLWVARECLSSTNVQWGAQDSHHAASGAHTGDVSAPMLADLGCRYVEIGHSERRRDHGETDALISMKALSVLRHGMTPILCVGEPARTDLRVATQFVTRQLKAGLVKIPTHDWPQVVIAYEPVWAIGVGADSAEPGYVDRMHEGIREAVGAASVRVIYGGSVNISTAGPLLRQRHVDGLFVGRAALDPSVFAEIVRIGADQPN